jgi:hypothetical protein
MRFQPRMPNDVSPRSLTAVAFGRRAIRPKMVVSTPERDLKPSPLSTCPGSDRSDGESPLHDRNGPLHLAEALERGDPCIVGQVPSSMGDAVRERVITCIGDGHGRVAGARHAPESIDLISEPVPR